MLSFSVFQHHDTKFSVSELLGMARGVASGMTYLSDRGYIHRVNCISSEKTTDKVFFKAFYFIFACYYGVKFDLRYSSGFCNFQQQTNMHVIFILSESQICHGLNRRLFFQVDNSFSYSLYIQLVYIQLVLLKVVCF